MTAYVCLNGMASYAIKVIITLCSINAWLMNSFNGKFLFLEIWIHVEVNRVKTVVVVTTKRTHTNVNVLLVIVEIVARKVVIEIFEIAVSLQCLLLVNTMTIYPQKSIYVHQFPVQTARRVSIIALTLNVSVVLDSTVVCVKIVSEAHFVSM